MPITAYLELGVPGSFRNHIGIFVAEIGYQDLRPPR
jgi:hypothetical protein